MNELLWIPITYLTLGFFSWIYQGIKDEFYVDYMSFTMNVGLTALFIFTWFLDLNKAAYKYNTSTSGNLEDALDKLSEVEDK